MRPVREMPDVELVLTAWLREALADAQPLGPPRVLTTLPGDLEHAVPIVQVQRVGGAMRYPHVLDEARLDVDSLHTTRADTAALAVRVRSLLASLPGTTTGGALITRVVEDVGPSWRPEPVPRVWRYGSALRVFLRPA